MKLTKKEILAYILVFIITMTLTFTFLKTFAFEKNEHKVNNEVSEELIKRLYSYIPNYRSYYNKYQNLSSSEIGKVIYNYILNYNNSLLTNYSINELESNEDVTPIGKIKKEDYEDVAYYIYGKDIKLNHQNLTLYPNIKALFKDDYYLIYKLNNYPDNNKERRIYTSYELTDNGNTIIIYDRYIICDISTKKCYNDTEKRSLSNYSFIVNDEVDLENNMSRARAYKHTFKKVDNNYIWVSSEIDD